MFWASNKLEPKRAFRWLGYVNLLGAGSDLGPKPFLIKSFTKPTFTLDSEKIINNFTSETEIIIKNYTWDDISITFYDPEPEELNVSGALFKWMQGLGYQHLQSVGNLSKLLTKLYDGNFNIALEHINSEGKPIEKWVFVNPQPTSINFGGELDYSSGEPMTVTLGVTYVSAYLELLGGGSLVSAIGGKLLG